MPLVLLSILYMVAAQLFAASQEDFMRQRINIMIPALTLASCLLMPHSMASAQSNDEKKSMLMFFKEEELVVESPTRSEKPIAQTAENVTVVTSEYIQQMNAHTVAEVLNTVTGVQVFLTGGPGSSALASIEGSENRHVAVFMDGIPLNNLGDNVVDIGLMSVQNIEKIEIIKGPASSAWGSSLGGVINIITKSGKEDENGGVVSASYGERKTGDFRVETSGKGERLGYYVSGGRLQTDGFRQNNDFSGNNVYSKLTYDMTERTKLQLTGGFNKASRGTAEFPNYDLFINDSTETQTASFSIKSAISKEVEVDISLWWLHQIYNVYDFQLSTRSQLLRNHFDDSGYGSSVKLTWKQQIHTLVLGADYDSKTLESDTIAGNKKAERKDAFYINDTMVFGPLSITPGIRYDKFNTNGEFTSPSIGMTYKVADTTILRVYSAQGFNVPPLSTTYGDNIFHISNPALKMERVFSTQIGIESAVTKYFWMKLSTFRHDVKDIITTERLSAPTAISINKGSERRQGVEIELKTAPVYYTSLSAGGVFMSAKDLDTDKTIQDLPERTYDLGVQFADSSSTLLLQGHYVDWNANPLFHGKYNDFIFDIHASRRLYTQEDKSLSLFVDAHNIFNGSQYAIDVYNNPARWIEAGARYTF